MKNLTKLLLASAFCVPLGSPTHAGVILERDLNMPGDGLLTLDVSQGLEFLDLTQSVGLSFDDVSGQFGAGGSFDGFRYASDVEVATLVNNAGFSPAFTFPLNNSVSSAFQGSTGRDQLSALASFLGVTASGSASRFAIGLTSRELPVGSSPFFRTIAIQDFTDNSTDDIVHFGFTASSSRNGASGSFLVRNAAAVPEPRGFGVLAFGACGFLIRRRRQLT